MHFHVRREEMERFTFRQENALMPCFDWELGVLNVAEDEGSLLGNACTHLTVFFRPLEEKA